MTTQTPSLTLAEAIFPQTGRALRVKQLVLVVAGITALILAAKIKIPMFPVPMTMGTFAVLSIGAAYGARLGLATILGYMLIGALGFDVFAGSSAEVSGVTYMMGGTGGYLVGYVLAAFVTTTAVALYRLTEVKDRAKRNHEYRRWAAPLAVALILAAFALVFAHVWPLATEWSKP